MSFKVLIADDDIITRRLVENVISKNGYEIVSCQNGTEAWGHLRDPQGPKLAILDWNMPGMQGIEICKRLREQKFKINPYLIILTASMNEKKDVIETFRTGANDYVEKPFDPNELIARVKLGERLITLQIELSNRIEALEAANQHIKTLQGILPICMHCQQHQERQRKLGTGRRIHIKTYRRPIQPRTLPEMHEKTLSGHCAAINFRRKFITSHLGCRRVSLYKTFLFSSLC